MASMHTRLNIKKLDVNIVQKHEGSKQFGFKQLGPGVETGVHGVHDEKRVWFEVELQGAQGDREAEVFQVSNDDTAVAQRRLEDKQPEEKTHTDCLRSKQQCMKSRVAKHLGVAGIQQQNGLVDETNVTLFAKDRSSHCHEVDHNTRYGVSDTRMVKEAECASYASARAWMLYQHVEEGFMTNELRDLNAEESWALLEDLALYDNESWNDPRDFAKPVKEIALPQDVPSTSDRQGLVSKFMASQDARLSKFEADFKRQQGEMTNKIDTVLKAITDQIAGALPSDMCEAKLDVLVLELLGLVPRSSNAKFICSKEDDGEVMFIEIIRDDEPQCEDPNEGEGATTQGPVIEYFDTFSTRDELTYLRYLMSGPIPSIFLRNPIIMEGCPSNLKIPCNIGHVHIKKAYIDLNSPLNIMTRMMYNWIMRRKLNPREDANGGVSNFMGRIKGMHIFVGNFTYIVDFMIVENISSIIDPRLTQVVLGKPFIEISNMTHDQQKGVVRFVNGNEEVAYKMPHKIEQYNSLSNLEKEHTN
ncbi:retrotransposon ORF1 [Tanacetum coccineum]